MFNTTPLNKVTGLLKVNALATKISLFKFVFPLVTAREVRGVVFVPIAPKVTLPEPAMSVSD